MANCYMKLKLYILQGNEKRIKGCAKNPSVWIFCFAHIPASVYHTFKILMPTHHPAQFQLASLMPVALREALISPLSLQPTNPSNLGTGISNKGHFWQNHHVVLGVSW